MPDDCDCVRPTEPEPEPETDRCKDKGGDADDDGCCADDDEDDDDPEVGCEDDCEKGRVDQMQLLKDKWVEKFSLTNIVVQPNRPTFLEFTFLMPGDVRRVFSLGYDLTVSDGAEFNVSSSSWGPLSTLKQYRDLFKLLITLIVWITVLKHCWYCLEKF